ncbi:ATP-binding protein [Pararobbsia alpina]|uniref:ATP-binding protein n=1 Tax=Pararobbsia alpina TaxID=621374 RepID=UPI001582F087
MATFCTTPANSHLGRPDHPERRGRRARAAGAGHGYGIEIEAGALGGIFELFSQSASGRSHREGGLGIGLSVVRELAAAHGGTNSVRSDGLDMGSTSTLSFRLSSHGRELTRRKTQRYITR